MEYEMQVKPFEQKDGVKYKILQITDKTLHTKKMKSTSVTKEIKKSFDSNQPGRIYMPDKIQGDAKTLIIEQLKNNPDFIKMIQEEERNGFKILLEFPREGVPTLAGKDTIEFVQSKNGQRILRKLANDKSKS